MKILHTSDWHLGKRLEHYSRIEEQRMVLEELCDIASTNKVDAVLVAGDLFDTINPPVEAIELLYKTLKKLTRNGQCAVIAIAGNHDSAERIESPESLARECGIIFAGYPHSQSSLLKIENGIELINSAPGFIEINHPNWAHSLRLLLTPYANELRIKTALDQEDKEQAVRDLLKEHWQNMANKHCNNQGVNILMSHLFFIKDGAPIPEEPEDEKPILYIGGAQPIYSSDIPNEIQYVALGHLHRLQTVDQTPCPIVYSGSPLAYSFSEAHQKKYAVLIDVEPNKPATITPIELNQGMPLERKRFTSINEAVVWLEAYPNKYIELTISTDTYLTAQERKLLFDSHNHIVTIIPEITGDANNNETNNKIAIDKTIDALFVDFFKHRNKGLEPNDRLKDLFKELLSEDK